MASRLKIELPVCPDPKCRHISKIPHSRARKDYCVGSVFEGTAHKKRRMVSVEFTAPAPKDGESA